MFHLARIVDLISNLVPQKQPRRRASSKGLHTQSEQMEIRLVPATVGVTKTAVIDFTGGVVTQAEMNQSAFTNTPQTSFSSFNDLYSNASLFRDWSGNGFAGDGLDRAFALNMFDVSGNGQLTSFDAFLARTRIMNKVRADFAPYDLQIIEGNNSIHRFRLNDSTVGDVIVMVAGDADIVGPTLATPGTATGWAGRDTLNRIDQYAFVFGGQLAQAPVFFNTPDKFINGVARTISHEMGHAFGLSHAVIDTNSDMLSHNLMGVPDNNVGDGDERDYNRDFTFLDWTVRVDTNGDNVNDSFQNAHSTLSRSDVLGISNDPWAAVLRPGTLTISGGRNSDILTLSALSNGDWRVGLNGVNSDFTRSGRNVNSLNSFDTYLNRVDIVGRAGHDHIIVNSSFNFRVWADGGVGNDRIYGGSANDTLRGGDGNDWIWGRWGNDRLEGGNDNDYLFGETGHDRLYGQNGSDYLSGGIGNDWLDGGNETNRDWDRLYGGYGTDTFVQHRGWWGFWNQDSLYDRHYTERIYYV